MTSALDFITAYFDAAWANPPASMMEAVQKYFSDDFQNLDKDGNVVMDKETFLGTNQMMLSSFPDFKEVTSGIRQEGDSDVIVDYHFEGTFAKDLDLSAMGLGVIPASGKKIVWPESTIKMKVKGDKITSLQEVVGGSEVFLAPLGVKLPAA